MTLDANLYVRGDFVMSASGATLNMGSSTLYLECENILFDAGTVNAETSRLGLVGTVAKSHYDFGAAVFNNVNFEGAGDDRYLEGTLTIAGDTYVTTWAGMYDGTVAMQGDLILADNWYSGTAKFLMNGTGAQTISATNTSDILTNLEIDKASGTLTLEGTIRVLGDFIHTAGTVDAGTSTVELFGWYDDSTFDAGSIAFNNLSFGGGYGITITGAVDVDGDLSITDSGWLDGGAINVAGDLISTDTSVGGTTTITLDGAGIQTITASGGAEFTDGLFSINKTTGNVVLLSDLTLTGTGQDLTLAAGTLNLNGYTLTVPDTLTLASGTEVDELGGTLSYGTLVDSGAAITSAAVWDGGGSTTNWSDAANWVEVHTCCRCEWCQLRDV